MKTRERNRPGEIPPAPFAKRGEAVPICRLCLARPVVFALLLLVAGCRKEIPNPTPKTTAAETAAQAKQTAPRAPLDYLEVLTGGARQDESLPMVVGVHGLGDTPENFKELYEALPFKSRVIVPRGFIPWHLGHSWFHIDLPYAEQAQTHGAPFSKAVALAADRVVALLAHLRRTRPTTGKPIITGFSQGGMISFTVAATHPADISLAIPIGGALPRRISPKPGARVPIRALHGAEDGVVPVAFAQKSISRLTETGIDASLVVYPGVPHAISEAMRRDLFKEIARHLKTR